MNWFRNLPIRLKLSLSITFLILAITIFLTLYFPSQLNKLVKHGLEQRGISVSSFLAYTVELAVELDNTDGALELMQGITKDPAVKYVLVLNSDKSVFSCVNTNSAAKLEFSSELNKSTVVDADGMMNVISPIGKIDDIKGFVIIGFSLNELSYAKDKNQLMTFAVSVSLLLLGILFAFIFGNSLSKRIVKTVNIAEQIAKGNINVKNITIESKDEIGRLNNAFNEMLENLKPLDEQARSIANDDLHNVILEKDIKWGFGSTFSLMVKNLRHFATMAKIIANGDMNNEALQTDLEGDLGNAFGKMIQSLKLITLQAKAISKDDLSNPIHNEKLPGDLGNAFSRMTKQLRLLAKHAKLISLGDLSNPELSMRVAGDLGTPFSKMVRSLKILAIQANTIANGDYSILSTKVEGELGDSIRNMTHRLSEATKENDHQLWLSKGRTKLNDAMRGELEKFSLGNKICEFFSEYIKVDVSALYTYNREGELQLTGSYALNRTKDFECVIEAESTLIKQAVKSKKKVLINNIPENVLQVNTSFGSIKPQYILVTPIVYEDIVIGVFELGFVNELQDEATIFINSVLESIAISFITSENRAKMKNLLKNSRKQSERLQSQQEELRASNEELEEQSNHLKISEEKLKSQQEELRASNEELEEQSKLLVTQAQVLKVKNDELEITKKEIEQKAKELEKSNTYKSEFLANMSHELRTPLNSILLLSKNLADNDKDTLSDREVKAANIINSSGSDLLSLINEILDLSKIEAGQMDIDLQEVLITDLALNIKNNFQHMAEDKNLYLAVNIEDELQHTIYTDVKRVEQIIKNLMSNSIKFTSEGGVSVNFGVPKGDVNLEFSGLNIAHTVAISVVDTGIGIRPEKLKAIFEAFQQADGSISREYGGTGLGLSISRELSRLLKGEIQVSSEYNKGTTFVIYLPAGEAKNIIVPDNVSQFKEDAIKNDGVTNSILDDNKIQPEDTVIENENNSEEVSLNNLKEQENKSQENEGEALILLMDDAETKMTITKIIRRYKLNVIELNDCETVVDLLETKKITGMLLDLDIVKQKTLESIEKISKKIPLGLPPIIFYSMKDLTNKEELSLNKYSENIIIKGLEFKQRLIDETTLFFHRIMGDNTTSKKQIVTRLKNTEYMFENKKVLLVDDDARSTFALSGILEEKKMSVLYAANGKEALATLNTETDVDIVLMDIMMPIMDGYETMKRIREDSRFFKLPIIALTAKAMAKDREKCNAAGASDYMTKPVDVSRLLSMMRVWLYR